MRSLMSQVLTLEVAPERQACMGMIPMQCLMVRERTSDLALANWGPLFDNIQGYTHLPGQHRTLRVRKDWLDKPPADGSSTLYTLLEMLD